jgi:hypothetical protein
LKNKEKYMIKILQLFIILWVIITPIKAEDTKSLELDDTAYLYRWSQGNQHEFTPQGQEDLKAWKDMITINVFPEITNGEQLAQIANSVLSRYEKIGSILRTDSKPRTENSEAEHLIVAILSSNGVMEAVHARIKLVQGKGTATVWSRREYGDGASKAVGSWLEKNGLARENIFMAWDEYPTLIELGQ